MGSTRTTETPNAYAPIYGLHDPIAVKIEKIARRVYGAGDVTFLPAALEKIERYTKDGLDTVPICMAKTHLSLTHDPNLFNAPEVIHYTLDTLGAAIGPLYGDMQTMPGLGLTPALQNVDVDESGRTLGLF